VCESRRSAFWGCRRRQKPRCRSAPDSIPIPVPCKLAWRGLQRCSWGRYTRTLREQRGIGSGRARRQRHAWLRAQSPIGTNNPTRGLSACQAGSKYALGHYATGRASNVPSRLSLSQYSHDRTTEEYPLGCERLLISVRMQASGTGSRKSSGIFSAGSQMLVK